LHQSQLQGEFLDPSEQALRLGLVVEPRLQGGAQVVGERWHSWWLPEG
jgi:hypothetical protein